LLLLAENPLLGELQPLLADGNYRRFVFRNYVIYYHSQQEELILVRVLHAAREQQHQFR